MNERTVVKCVVGGLASVAILASGVTDLIYPLAAAYFFGLCVAYAAWCERL
jgi:hypothetical protein